MSTDPGSVRTLGILRAENSAGDQIHLEDLTAYLAGGERCDARARWQELMPGYEQLARQIP